LFSIPKNGWVNLTIENWTDRASYLTDVPVDLLEAFIDYHTQGYGMAWFDEEGTEFTLVITPYSLYIIEEKDESVLYDFSEMKFEDIEKELIAELEKDLDGWSREFVIDDDEEEIKIHREEIRQKIAILKKLINY
jgi:hypothetical protein